MPEPPIHTHRLDNGLTLVAEPHPAAQSLAVSWLLPAGVGFEPEERPGLASLLSELICRGAGERSAREHSHALDRLGVDRSTSVRSRHLGVFAAMLGRCFDDAFPLLVDMVRRPRLSEDALEPARALALQDLDALDDDPQGRVMDRVVFQHLPRPLGRSRYGTREGVRAISIDELRRFHAERFTPDGAVLSVAGRFDWDRLRRSVDRELGDWTGPERAELSLQPPARGYRHESDDSAQTHIALAADAVPQTHEASDLQRAAVAVLSGGMSGRLFTELRERRGLCYAVFAQYSADRDWGAVVAYVGTTAARAQESHDVLLEQLQRLADGVEPDEFERALVGMKSRLVRQGESTRARAAALAKDITLYDEPRSLEQWAQRVDRITREHVEAHLKQHPIRTPTLCTIGPEKLNVNV